MTQSPEIITFGCRLNAAESETLRRLSAREGCVGATIINTCAVTNEAVRSARQRIRRIKRAAPDAKIVVTGCAAQTEPETFAAMPEVAAVIGNQEKLDAAQWQTLGRAFRQPQDDAGDKAGSMVSVNDIMSVRDTAGHMVDGYGDRARAFLQIQNGCDHRCTFCIIPYGRGNSRSVPVADVIEQAKRLVDNGHRELVLTGVDITSYGADLDGSPSLGALVAALLDRVPDLYRLRLSSIDGAEIDETLYERIISEPRIAPHLHLSLQSGDNMILKRMKRRHTREQAIGLCASVRAARPEIAFGADIIAGFPTETEAMFQNSLNIIEEAGLSYLHVFPFSPRHGTPAARMPQAPRAEVKERAARLRQTGEKALHAFLDSLVGRTEDAILESGGRARLGNFAAVNFGGGDAQVGDVIRLRITGREGDALIGAAA